VFPPFWQLAASLADRQTMADAIRMDDGPHKVDWRLLETGVDHGKSGQKPSFISLLPLSFSGWLRRPARTRPGTGRRPAASHTPLNTQFGRRQTQTHSSLWGERGGKSDEREACSSTVSSRYIYTQCVLCIHLDKVNIFAYISH